MKVSMNRSWMCLFVSLLMLAACKRQPEEASGKNSGQRGRPMPNVSVLKVESQAVRYTVDTTGTLEADEIRIHARVSGVITRLSKKFLEGQTVSPDEDVLAEIDPERYALELAQAKAAKERASAAHTKAKIDHATRVDLHQKGVVTQDEVATYETAMKEAQAVLDHAAATLALAEKNARDSTVRPPVKGTIQSKSVVLGEYVKPETLVATLVDLSTMRLRFSVPESEAARLSVGEAVTFVHKSMPELRFASEIFFVSQTAHPQTRRVECKAKNIRLADPGVDPGGFALKPGYFVTVQIQTGSPSNAVTVPSRAILPTEIGFVAFVLDGKTVRRRSVTLGMHTRDEQIEITSGLKAGDVLIVRGASVLRDGMEVNVVTDKK